MPNSRFKYCHTALLLKFIATISRRLLNKNVWIWIKYMCLQGPCSSLHFPVVISVGSIQYEEVSPSTIEDDTNFQQFRQNKRVQFWHQWWDKEQEASGNYCTSPQSCLKHGAVHALALASCDLDDRLWREWGRSCKEVEGLGTWPSFAAAQLFLAARRQGQPVERLYNIAKKGLQFNKVAVCVLLYVEYFLYFLINFL